MHRAFEHARERVRELQKVGAIGGATQSGSRELGIIAVEQRHRIKWDAEEFGRGAP